MKLRLADKITNLLVNKPGLSISQLTKKTKNYYCYVHKIVNEMESKGLLKINKKVINNKTITKCYLIDDYKDKWVARVKKLFKPLMIIALGATLLIILLNIKDNRIISLGPSSDYLIPILIISLGVLYLIKRARDKGL